ncbi:hypothetical protein [Maribacter aestuarii]|uniref:hypothetical protein n=1 Tax=Maribacter aestuarii TaxID=1130723 RepID=UPI00248B2A11|nr:hypothetical protein [Maribacter aestuarii]
MRQYVTTALLLFISFCIHSQIIYENGYFIDMNGERKDGLIKNNDWAHNPDSFKYKISENDKEQILKTSDVKEFGFYNGIRYISAIVKIDLSPDDFERLTTNRLPNFTEQRLFLKELVAGESPLYLYTDGNITRFFYRVEENRLEPLVYKRYLVNDSKIRAYERFKQQLINHIKCEVISESDIKSTTYSISSLTKIFRDYNICLNPNISFEKISKNKSQINLSLKSGLQYGNVEYLRTASVFSAEESFDFGNSLGFRLGIETEFVLPFNKNKWGIFIEPTYQVYNSKNSSDNFSITYKSIEVPLGLRHYLYLNDLRLFMNAAGVYDIPLNSNINENIKISSSANLMYGLGLSFKEKYSLEIRRTTTRELLSDFRGESGDYNLNFIIILGIIL